MVKVLDLSYREIDPYSLHFTTSVDIVGRSEYKTVYLFVKKIVGGM